MVCKKLEFGELQIDVRDDVISWHLGSWSWLVMDLNISQCDKNADKQNNCFSRDDVMQQILQSGTVGRCC